MTSNPTLNAIDIIIYSVDEHGAYTEVGSDAVLTIQKAQSLAQEWANRLRCQIDVCDADEQSGRGCIATAEPM